MNGNAAIDSRSVGSRKWLRSTGTINGQLQFENNFKTNDKLSGSSG